MRCWAAFMSEASLSSRGNSSLSQGRREVITLFDYLWSNRFLCCWQVKNINSNNLRYACYISVLTTLLLSLTSCHFPSKLNLSTHPSYLIHFLAHFMFHQKGNLPLKRATKVKRNVPVSSFCSMNLARHCDW